MLKLEHANKMWAREKWKWKWKYLLEQWKCAEYTYLVEQIFSQKSWKGWQKSNTSYLCVYVVQRQRQRPPNKSTTKKSAIIANGDSADIISTVSHSVIGQIITTIFRSHSSATIELSISISLTLSSESHCYRFNAKWISMPMPHFQTLFIYFNVQSVEPKIYIMNDIFQFLRRAHYIIIFRCTMRHRQPKWCESTRITLWLDIVCDWDALGFFLVFGFLFE